MKKKILFPLIASLLISACSSTGTISFNSEVNYDSDPNSSGDPNSHDDDYEEEPPVDIKKERD